MIREDYDKFMKGKSRANGAWCIYCHEPGSDIGYKIYGRMYYHAHAFTHFGETGVQEQKLKWAKHDIDPDIENRFEIIRDEELQEFYDYLNFLYHKRCVPKVHEIFTYGSITGIVHTNCARSISQTDWDNRKELIGEGYKFLPEKPCDSSWGYMDGKIVMLDFDYWNFNELQKNDFQNRKWIEEFKEI